MLKIQTVKTARFTPYVLCLPFPPILAEMNFSSSAPPVGIVL